MTITGRQVKAARLLLGWSRETLAGETGLSSSFIERFENEERRPSVLCVSMIKSTLDTAGVEFVDGEPGVKLKAVSVHPRR